MFQEVYMKKIVATVGVMAILALAAYTYYTMKQAQYMYSGPVTIQATGEGEVQAVPDVATFTFSVEAKDVDATVAQNKGTEIMNGIVAYLKEKGVDEKDIKTEWYDLSPEMEYPTPMPCTQFYCPPQGEPKQVGYMVNQSVKVKVRDISKAGELVSGVGSKSAKNVSGLAFTIDDEDAYKAQAREMAIKDAQAKAEVLAKNLGARIVRMNGYWEDEGYPVMYGGYGGAADMAVKTESAPRPVTIPTGESTITSKVTITYEIK